MRRLIIPSEKNNFKAKLLQLPFSVLLVIGLLTVNVLQIFPARVVEAAIDGPGLLQLHNQERAQLGLGQLKLNSTLSSSAQKKAKAMLDADCWSHYCPNGKSPWDFFVEAGYAYLYAGENLAEGFNENTDVMTAWMQSPTHKENIVRPEYTEVGFGIVTGRFQGKDNNMVVVAHFATPQPVVNGGVLSSPPPAPAPTVNVLPEPNITFPQNNSFLNVQEVELQGTAPDAEKVTLFENGVPMATANPKEGIFTYKMPTPIEREYLLNAQSQAGQAVSKMSPQIKFTVDRTSEPINVSDLVLTRFVNTNQVEMQVSKANLKSVKVVGPEAFDFWQSADTTWTVQVPIQIIHGGRLQLATTDLANNSWLGTFVTAPLVEQLSSLPLKIDNRAFTVTQSQVNLIFLILLAFLYLIDSVVLQRTGISKYYSRGRSGYHFALLVVVAVIVMTGAIWGNVGSGLGN